MELACRQNDDLELVALFTRRDPATVKPLTEGVPVFAAADMEAHQADVDVLVLCGGSANDLPEQTPACASMFNVVDSFDTHANIPAHFADVDAAAKVGGKVAVISAGWDPGMFSIARLYASSVLPEGEDYTFWGRGVSQGHSDAIRRIEGVADARQYTVPVASALEAVRNGEKPQLTTRQKHTRECFVVAEEGADLAAIEKAIVEMPNYIPHGGSVFRSGVTGQNGEHTHVVEYSLKLDSNPEFTGSVLAACARAAHRLSREGAVGCKTMFDIAPAYLSAKSDEQLRAEML